MAERELNFDAPLLSTRRFKKTAVSVRKNMSNKLPDDSNTTESHSVPVLVQDMGLDLHVLESVSVPFKFQDCVDENLTRPDSSKGKQVDKEEGESEDDDDDDGDVFSDARDTLSVKHSATTPPTPSEDFVLNRFLPASKSMTVEQQPQYALKQQSLPVKSGPMRHIRDIVPAENHVTPKRYESVTKPPYFQSIDYDESEDDEDDDEYLSKRGCGMMSPQLCFKNSLSMLSPVHGKAYSLRTSSHDQVKSSKVAQLISRFQSVKKLALKLGSRAQSPLHPSFGKKLNSGSEQLESNLSTVSMPSSPYRETGCMSPYRTSGIISPLHPAGFPGTRKEAEIMRANRLNKHIRNNIKSHEILYPKSTRLDCSTSSVREKTLYVDTENFPNKGNSNIKILPETVETISEEPGVAGNKQKAILELQAAKNLTTNSGCDLSPLVPPPPKKPSDSWLLRNLPSVSSKISSRRYLLHPQKKDFEENSTSVTKWETIVKTSCMHRDHIRYSEELVARSSFQAKT